MPSTHSIVRPSRSIRRWPAAAAAAIALAALLGACSGKVDDAGAVRPQPGGVRVVSPEDAWKIVQAKSERLVVLDVRTPPEAAQGHLPGAMLIDFYATDFRTQIATLDRAGQYVLYCRTGNRSGQARQIMQDLGFTEVYDISGGIVAWKAAGLPTTTD